MSSDYKVIISISSDIASELAEKWLANGEKVIGTYRNWNDNLEALSKYDSLTLLKLDFAVEKDFYNLIKLVNSLGKWRVLVIASGSQEPIGKFLNMSFLDWAEGIKFNFLCQMRIVHSLLPLRCERTESDPTVLFFAGGGTNNSVKNYSAYTISKISLIKMCELLSTELPDVKFSIVGPGWVKTKIHKATLQDLGKKSEENYQKTVDMLDGIDLVPISEVVKSCEWIIDQKINVVTGRNFSTKFDQFNDSLGNALISDTDMYKLRRYKNEWTE